MYLNNRRQFLSSLAATVALKGQTAQHPLSNDDRLSHGVLHHNMQLPSIYERSTPNTHGLINTISTRNGDAIRSNTYTDPILCSKLLDGTIQKKFDITVPGDPRIEAQPLFAPSIETECGEERDLVIFSGMSGQVSAFDANDGTPIWTTFLGTPINGSSKIDAWNINIKWSILSTGVIIGTNLYVVAWTSKDGTVENAQHNLHVINISTGFQSLAPLLLTSIGEMARKQRGSLLAIGNMIYIPWGTIAETAAGAHGFLTQVDVNRWAVVKELNTTVKGVGGGLWNSGQGPVYDGEFIYTSTGNGDYDGVNNFGESIIKIDPKTLTIVDHWNAFSDSSRVRANGGQWADQDLGSSQVLLCQDKGLLVVCGKDGVAYVLDTNNLAKGPIFTPIFITFNGLGLNATSLNDLDQVHYGKTFHQHASLLYFNDQVWCFGENNNLRCFNLDSNGILTFVARSAETASVYAENSSGMPGGFSCAIRGSDSQIAIVSVIPDGDANKTVTTGRLFAFNADSTKWNMLNADGDRNITRTWMSNDAPNGHDSFSKFMVPVVPGNGYLYYARYNGNCSVYG